MQPTPSPSGGFYLIVTLDRPSHEADTSDPLVMSDHFYQLSFSPLHFSLSGLVYINQLIISFLSISLHDSHTP